MQTALGEKLWLHTQGAADEIVISSHGYRDRDNPKTFSLRHGFLYDTTIYFQVEDGDPSGVRLPQVMEGKGNRGLMHTTEKAPYVYDYYLQKFQVSSGRGGDRHTVGATETYASIANLIDSQNNHIAPGALHDYRQGQIDRYGTGNGFNGGGDFVPRGVITVRSGGPFSKQKVLLSEVIRAAQTPPLRYTVFWCLFCRSVA